MMAPAGRSIRCSHHDQVLVDRDGGAEGVCAADLVRQEFADLRACGRVEEVDRAGVGAVGVVAGSTDGDDALTDCNGAAEKLIRGSVGVEQRVEVFVGDCVEDMHRAGPFAEFRGVGRSDHQELRVEVDGVAEPEGLEPDRGLGRGQPREVFARSVVEEMDGAANGAGRVCGVGGVPAVLRCGDGRDVAVGCHGARVGVVVGLFEALGGEVGVDLGGAEGLVAEQFLHAAEVGAVVEEVGGEGVAQGVGADGGVEADLLEVLVELAADGAGERRLPCLLMKRGALPISFRWPDAARSLESAFHGLM
jgi:hypothetical protein